jgi:hypothetical protein
LSAGLSREIRRGAHDALRTRRAARLKSRRGWRVLRPR